MKSKSTQIYLGLIVLLAVFSTVSIFLPQGSQFPTQELPASKPVLALVNALIMLVIYGGLGYVGLILSRKIGFALIWDEDVNNFQRFIKPALIGLSLGLLLILLDLIFSRYNSFGRLPHPAFPTSLIASITAGIGEEALFRLFFISFWVWLISYKIFKKKYFDLVFWIVAGVSAVVFAVSHFPSIMYLIGVESIQSLPKILIVELLVMNGIVSVLAAYYLRKHGFLAAVGIHFWTNVVWHVLWGLF